MKKGNWNSRRAYKRDLNGCHRAGAPRRQIRWTPGSEGTAPTMGATALAIVRAALRFGRGNK